MQPHNPILDQVALGIKTIVAIPREMVLVHAPASVLETGANILAHQFREGVQFMHDVDPVPVRGSRLRCLASFPSFSGQQVCYSSR